MAVSRIQVRELSMQVHLGCTERERSLAQEILVSFVLDFAESPPGEATDRLEDTVCYDRLCQKLVAHTENRQFQLIEKMAADFLAILRQSCPSLLIQLKVHKVRPPIDGLKGGVVYVCGDTLP